MPLSKERNRDRMRLIRRNKRSLSPRECKSVQPKIYTEYDKGKPHIYTEYVVDADGNVIPREE